MSSTTHPGAPARSRVIELRPRAIARRTAGLRARTLERRHAAGPHQDRLLEIVVDVLARVGQVTAADLDTWERLLLLLEEQESSTYSTPASAATTNLVALAFFDEPVDHAAVADLADQLGHERLARLQHRYGTTLEPHSGLPLTTEAVRRLVASGSLRAAHALLGQGIDRAWTVPVLDSVEELLDIAERGTIVEWRHHLSMVIAKPWSPYSGRIVELAQEAGRSHTAAVIAAIVELCREQSGTVGRGEVAGHEIGALMARTHRRLGGP